jgi:hypothetical protein
MQVEYFGYVSIPFGIKNGINFDELFKSDIFPAPTAAINQSNVQLFREDTSIQAPWKSSVKHVLKVDSVIGPSRIHETQLRQSIQENIAASDFVVAVLTGLNPNVMLEVGFAQAMKKIIIYLMRKDQHKDIMPSNLGNLKRLHLYGDDEDLKLNLYYRIQEAISALEDQRNSELKIGGIDLNYFKSRISIDLWRQFENVKKRIWILTTNLTTVNANFIDSIVVAVNKNPLIEVKILTSDPENEYIGPRAKQLGENELGYKMELQGSLQSIIAKFQKFKKCEIKTYTDFPVQLWHLVDDYLYVGQSSLLRRTRHNCVYGINVEVEGVKETYLDHFERLWDGSSTPKMKNYK